MNPARPLLFNLSASVNVLFAPNVFFISLEFLVLNTNDSLNWLLIPVEPDAAAISQTPWPDSKYNDAEVTPVADSIFTLELVDELTTRFSSTVDP